MKTKQNEEAVKVSTSGTAVDVGGCEVDVDGKEGNKVTLSQNSLITCTISTKVPCQYQHLAACIDKQSVQLFCTQAVRLVRQ